MAVYVVQIVRSGAQTFTNGRDCVLVNAATAADARAVAKNVQLGSGYTAAMWDAATVTELAAPADLTGFRLRVTLLGEGIDVTVTAGEGDTIDDMGTAMASALNALAAIAGAAYDTDTNLLTIAAEDDELATSTALVQFLPPLADAIYGDPSVPIPSFVTGITAPGGTNEIQTITIEDATYGTFTITYAGQTTSALAYNANAATVQAALIALSNLASGDVVVTGTSVVTGLTLTFGGTLAGTDVAEVTATLTGLVNTAVATDTAGVAAVDEVQSITVDAAGGTFTATFEGQTTSAIAFDADAATVELALEALSNIGVGEATCAGTLAGGMTITFSGALGASPRTEITCNAGSLTGGAGTAVPATDTPGVAPVDEVQSIVVQGYPSGTFTATYSGQTTGTIARNAAAAAVQTALRALSNIEDADMVCAGGPLGTAPVTCTFQGALAGTDVAAMTLTTTGLVPPEETIATATIGGALTATLVASSPPQAYNDPGLNL